MWSKGEGGAEAIEHTLRIISKFIQEMGKKERRSDAEAHRKAMIVSALYRGLMADLVLGIKKSEVREVQTRATDILLRRESESYVSSGDVAVSRRDSGRPGALSS